MWRRCARCSSRLARRICDSALRRCRARTNFMSASGERHSTPLHKSARVLNELNRSSGVSVPPMRVTSRRWLRIAQRVRHLQLPNWPAPQPAARCERQRSKRRAHQRTTQMGATLHRAASHPVACRQGALPPRRVNSAPAEDCQLRMCVPASYVETPTHQAPACHTLSRKSVVSHPRPGVIPHEARGVISHEARCDITRGQGCDITRGQV